jgi:macrolide-specific efflux system membrane fusion protein
VTLADTSAYVLVASLNEIDVARVKEGQEATLSFDAFGPENKVTGRVGAIPSYGRYNNGIAEYPVRIALDGLELPVMEGMGASISIPLGVRQDVLIIPAAAIDYYPDGTYVNVVKGEQVERRRVELGVGDGITVEVVEGLEMGEVVRVRLVGNQLYGAVVRGG